MTPAYVNWATKPGNLQRKAQACKDSYHYKKSLGLCPRNGCKNAAEPGGVLCAEHRKVG